MCNSEQNLRSQGPPINMMRSIHSVQCFGSKIASGCDSEHDVWPLPYRGSMYLIAARQQPDRQWCLGWDTVRDQYSRDSLLTALSIIHKSIHGWQMKHSYVHTHAYKMYTVAKRSHRESAIEIHFNLIWTAEIQNDILATAATINWLIDW